VPLTPIQKALDRLERGGLIGSYYEGKTRLYHFNPAYPLIHEVEQLLKKAYTLLPAHEKKNYYVVKDDLTPHLKPKESKIKILNTFWERLTNVNKLTFFANTKSREENGWQGRGAGEVMVVKEENKLYFHEKGTWQNKEGEKTNFSNVFRWTIDRSAGVISLEHLRRGADHPVFLFHMAPSSSQSLSSVDSHLCGGDTYFGQIHFDQHSLRLNWRVIGPKKNEEIDYYYS